MNKSEMAISIAVGAGVSRADAMRMIDAFFASVHRTLKRGGSVSIRGVGIFSVRKRAAHTARNPKSGEPVKVRAKKTVAFRASNTLKKGL